MQDPRHTDIQSSLLAYLLPFCLELWCEDLRGTSDKYGGFVEHLYPVLADRAIFDKHLTSKQSAAVSEFMRQTIVEEMDDQSGLAYRGSKARPYRWIRALTTYGVLLPDVDRMWEFEGHLYTHHWLEPNVAFLKGALNVARVTEDLNRAVDRLVDHSEHATGIEIANIHAVFAHIAGNMLG